MKMLYLVLLILVIVQGVEADIIIEDISNVKYIDSYNYTVFVDNNYLGEYEKGEVINVSDGDNVVIYVPSNIKQNINADNLASMVGVGFYAFMQYGIYIIIILIVFFWRRKK